MKQTLRSLFAAFLAAAFLILSSCGAKPAGTVTESAGETSVTRQGETRPEKTAETAPVLPEKLPKSPLSKAEFEALPVANASMTERELRELVVAYYKMMATIRWAPSSTFTYEYSSSSASDAAGNLRVPAGLIYDGMPYTKACAGLQDFLDYYDDTTGVLNVEDAKGVIASRIGNNCATSVFWAWARVSGSADYVNTNGMAPVNGLLKVGSYVFDETRDYNDQSTKGICEQNGEQKMFASYAEAKAGDGTVKYVSGGAHHARLVIEDAHVVKNANGAIDGEKSYFIVAEQGSGQTRTVDEETGEVYYDMTMVGNKYTFAAMYKEGSLPVTVPELAGTKKVQPAEASFSMEGGFTPEKANQSVITTNYPISRVDVTFVSSDGTAVIDKTAYSEAYKTKYKFELSRLTLSAPALRRSLKTGETYTVTIRVRLGNGETLEVYNGVYTA